jgi:hyperosmotically inducible protein
MKTKTLISAFLIGALAVPFAGYAADYDKDRSSPKDFVKDSVITAKIKAEYAKDKDVSAMSIKVDTDDKGVVTLSGNAKSKAEADKAVMIARDTKGVTSVKNEIQVK